MFTGFLSHSLTLFWKMQWHETKWNAPLPAGGQIAILDAPPVDKMCPHFCKNVPWLPGTLTNSWCSFYFFHPCPWNILSPPLQQVNKTYSKKGSCWWCCILHYRKGKKINQRKKKHLLINCWSKKKKKGERRKGKWRLVFLWDNGRIVEQGSFPTADSSFISASTCDMF